MLLILNDDLVKTCFNYFNDISQAIGTYTKSCKPNLIAQ